MIQDLNPNSDKEQFEACINIIRQSNNIQVSKDISEKYLDKALNLIDELEDNQARNLFKKLIKKMGSRNV